MRPAETYRADRRNTCLRPTMSASQVLGNPMVLSEAHEEGDRIHTTKSRELMRSSILHFLNGTKIQFAWDSTSLEALKKCPRYYQLTMIDNWQLRGDAIHLRWGQEFHYAIEDYERSRAAKLTHDDSVFDTVRALVGRIEGWTTRAEDQVGGA